VLGQKGGVHWTTGDEHTPRGHISEDPKNRVVQMDKRMSKETLAAQEIPSEKKLRFFGPKDADLTVVSWGSNKGAILDAMDRLKEDGKTVNFLHITLLAPFPTREVTEILEKAKKTVIVEQNFTGQLAGWIRQNTGIAMDHFVLKYTGRPITEDEVVSSLTKILEGKSKPASREVLTHGV
jgi:2-oxoglutarate ferredoxin oxidoreductase subunit alpha